MKIIYLLDDSVFTVSDAEAIYVKEKINSGEKIAEIGGVFINLSYVVRIVPK